MTWRRIAIATPYLWLLVFFLAPFAIILKISLADPVLAQPPFSQTASLENFAFLLTDKLYAVTYLRSVIMAAGAFGMIVLLSRQGMEAEAISDFKGLNARSPWFALMMLFFMFGMAGDEVEAAICTKAARFGHIQIHWPDGLVIACN